MTKLVFWIAVLILAIIVLVVIDLGYVPGVPQYARGFLWLIGIGGFLMWMVLFYISENLGFIVNVATAGLLFAALYVWLRWGNVIMQFARDIGLWDLLDISG